MIRHSSTVAVGVLSPIPGSAALLSNYLAEKKKKVFILGSDDPNYRPDHGVAVFGWFHSHEQEVVAGRMTAGLAARQLVNECVKHRLGGVA